MNDSKSTIYTTKKWTSTAYPYKTDYNDHFETPLRAYEDIAPLLDIVGPQTSKDKTSRKQHILYDPYYCDGQTITLLKNLNFTNVIHNKRDFYKVNLIHVI